MATEAEFREGGKTKKLKCLFLGVCLRPRGAEEEAGNADAWLSWRRHGGGGEFWLTRGEMGAAGPLPLAGRRPPVCSFTDSDTVEAGLRIMWGLFFTSNDARSL